MDREQKYLEAFLDRHRKLTIPIGLPCCVHRDRVLDPMLYRRIDNPDTPMNPPFFYCDYRYEHRCQTEECLLTKFSLHVWVEEDPETDDRVWVAHEIEFLQNSIDLYTQGDPRVIVYPDERKDTAAYKVRDKVFYFEDRSAMYPWLMPLKDSEYPDATSAARAMEPAMFGPILHPLVVFQDRITQADHENGAPVNIVC